MKIVADDLTLSLFEGGDVAALHAVRNDPDVRRHMADPRPLTWAAHRAWVEANLLNTRRLLLFLVRVDGDAVGFTLLRPAAGAAEIGVVFRDPLRHAFAIHTATLLTLHIALEQLDLPSLVSYVMPEHERALAFNRGFGGTEVESDRPPMVKLHARRADLLASHHYQRGMSRIRDRTRQIGTIASTPW